MNTSPISLTQNVKCFVGSLLLLLSSVSAVNAEEQPSCAPVFDMTERALHSNDYHDLCALTAGKTVLVVNTASRCGFTGQFADLEALFADYQDKDFMLLGFPSNSFRQEHSDEEDTAEVCFRNFGVTFPMMATTAVTGREAHPVFKKLAEMTGQSPRWNFHKYLINKDGTEALAFRSSISPSDPAILEALEKFLSDATPQ